MWGLDDVFAIRAICIHMPQTQEFCIRGICPLTHTVLNASTTLYSVQWHPAATYFRAIKLGATTSTFSLRSI